jgi:uncharacterized protein YbbC (DUF1343 family)
MRVGLDRLFRNRRLLSELTSRRVGLLAHPASVDRELRHVSQVLRSCEVSPRIIFGPEHGYGGEAQDMIGVADARSPEGVPIVSLYGDTVEALSPTAEQLAEVDLLVIDLADVGSRYYTFVWTALLAARRAVERGVEVLILDRPNPLGGVVEEGRCVTAGFASFVGLEPVPVRHALTLGEIVALFLESATRDALRIVGVRGWERGRTARGWDRPFVMTSPNMPSLDTALVYPGGCLIEGTNLSEGRGTTRPFEIVGAPFLDGHALAAALAATGLPGFVARPLSFLPTFHKHAGKPCGGVQIHVVDEATFRPYATYLALVALARRQAPDAFAWRTERYEFIDHIPAFDLLAGSADARGAIDAGAAVGEILDAECPVDATWRERAADARQRAAALDVDA